ncbi:MAG: sigma-54 dependent transcriptional regulator [Acidobacteriota bacterium]
MKEALKILCIDDDELITKALRRILVSLGYQVQVAEGFQRGLVLIEESHFDLVLTDLSMPDGDGMDIVRKVKELKPDTEVIVISAHGSVARAIEATKAGAYYFLEKPIDAEQLELLVGKALERRRLVVESETLRQRMRKRSEYMSMVGGSRAMQEIFETIESIAATDANVLIIGESGTGKELIANAIHFNSQRAKKAFIKVNCAAIPKELFESELFGHIKGAFTGATEEKQGLIGAAQNGSLLLDEIGEMPIELQPKLLRVLEGRTYRQLGSSREEAVDFRLISSTNRDPQKATRDGLLREDLFYRINTITLEIPPLRKRSEDISLLADHFIKQFASKYSKPVNGLTPSGYERLFEHHWPGNVRELQNVLERAVLLCRGDEIDAAELRIEPSHTEVAVPVRVKLDAEVDGSLTLDEMEKQIILKALERTKWNKQAAAKLLGIYRPRLYNLMKKHNIAEAIAAD